MKSLACLLLLLAACTDDNVDLPVIGGVHGGATSGGTTGFPTGDNIIRGQVCLLSDLLTTGMCATSGVAGLTVSAAGVVTTTASNGTFALAVPTTVTTPITTFSVSGGAVVPAVTNINATLVGTGTPAEISLPVIRQDLFNRVLTQNGITPLTGSGSIVATVVRGGVPVAGVSAISTPSPAFGPFFDGTQPNTFTLNATGQRGVVFFPGVTIGPTSLTFTDLGTTTETTVDGVQVINGGITFIDAVLP